MYILEDKEYKNRGRGLLKVLKLDISFDVWHCFPDSTRTTLQSISV